ncbi:c-type cytochrome [Shimia aestuarii]|uniref:Cytochrome c556 n=1 Tax=Shimia aestuarii TaxID=254406 RepID=A0A1I4NI06_9RHOB|nr:cytochrome c [Shimia aestuarii]SFM15000.1 Cytochrome c556 [Shimia aestuarii]
MKRRLKTLATATTLALLAGAAFADGHVNAAIKARQAQMQLYAFNIGQLGAMAKGEMDYDAAVASAAANNLLTLTKMDQSAMWPGGSDSMSVDGTRAKPDMWDNFPDVMAKGKALGDAAMAMQAAAGGGLDSLRGAMGALGGSCSSCHKPYREPES